MNKRLILSIFSFLISSIVPAQNTAGDALFGAAQVHDVYLNFSQIPYWDTLTANYTTDIYTKCDLVIDGVSLLNVGAKMKGNSSYNNPSIKKSFKVGIDEFVSGQKYDNLKKFNLNNCFKDPSFLREKLMLDFLNQLGYPAPRCTYARLYLNNTYWGLYTMVEEVDKTFLKDRFSDKKGNLWKGDPSGDLKWLGSNDSLYFNKYELKTNETLNDWSGLVQLINKINNSANLYDSLEPYLNTSNVIKGWVGCNLFANLDSYLGSGHNYFIYDDSLSNKFNWITWDVNEAFGNFNMGMTPAQLKAMSIFYISSPATSRPLYTKMLANTTYKANYISEYCNAAYYFTNAMLDAKIDSLKNMIMNDVSTDPNKFFTYQNFLDNIVMDISVSGTPGGNNICGIKPFITARHNAVVAELANQGCFVGIQEVAATQFLKLFPNPANSSFTIESSGELNSCAVMNVMGETVIDLKNSGTAKLTIDVKTLPEGIYFVRVNNTVTQKVLISR
ncbi:MAG: CotH kinase family protein [Bacteroidia bacterium]